MSKRSKPEVRRAPPAPSKRAVVREAVRRAQESAEWVRSMEAERNRILWSAESMPEHADVGELVRAIARASEASRIHDADVQAMLVETSAERDLLIYAMRHGDAPRRRLAARFGRV